MKTTRWYSYRANTKLFEVQLRLLLFLNKLLLIWVQLALHMH
jgi:hypothetical protein